VTVNGLGGQKGGERVRMVGKGWQGKSGRERTERRGGNRTEGTWEGKKTEYIVSGYEAGCKKM